MAKFNYNNYDWYCDQCDAHLNNQSGFTGENGTWQCVKCGALNFINRENVLTDYGQKMEYFMFVHCPSCDAHLIEDAGEMVCPDCGFRCSKNSF